MQYPYVHPTDMTIPYECALYLSTTSVVIDAGAISKHTETLREEYPDARERIVMLGTYITSEYLKANRALKTQAELRDKCLKALKEQEEDLQSRLNDRCMERYMIPYNPVSGLCL